MKILKLTIFVIANLMMVSAHGQVYQSIKDGDFSDGSVWSTNGGISTCKCNPIGSNQIEIYNKIVLDNDLTNGGGKYGQISDTLRIHMGASLIGATFNMTIASGGVLINNDTLEVNNMTWNNGSSVLFNINSYTHIKSDLTNANNSDNVKIDGKVKVNRDLTNGNGAIIIGGGTIDVDGNTTDKGMIFGGLLPIELLYLNAQINDDNSVQLNWATALEINNHYFTIERATNTELFKEIVQIDGAGNSHNTLSYNYLDTEFDQSGTIYYRLKQTDFDGTYTYSSIIAVKFESIEMTNIYPNPATDRTSIKINTNFDTDINIKVFNISGNMVMQLNQYIGKGLSIINLDVSAFDFGSYIVIGETSDGDTKIQQTFIKN